MIVYDTFSGIDRKQWKDLVEKYGVIVDQEIHKEVLERWKKLNIAPYAGFINPKLVPVMNGNEFRFSHDKKKEIEDFAKTCDALLFDYQINGKSGGTGRQIPIKILLEAVKIAKNANYNVKIFLAGGINSERLQNKKEVLEKVIDYVDVNSGVEYAPGIKNPDRVDDLMKIRALI